MTEYTRDIQQGRLLPYNPADWLPENIWLASGHCMKQGTGLDEPVFRLIRPAILNLVRNGTSVEWGSLPLNAKQDAGLGEVSLA